MSRNTPNLVLQENTQNEFAQYFTRNTTIFSTNILEHNLASTREEMKITGLSRFVIGLRDFVFLWQWLLKPAVVTDRSGCLKPCGR